jgi:tRNA-dihydrouridine synthase A
VFIIHARKAWLNGLSPRQNRELPPLRYEVVYRLKRDLPDLTIVINGGVSLLQEVSEHLHFVDGVMIGRAAYRDPYLLATVDKCIYGTDGRAPSRREAIERFIPYIESQLAAGVPLAAMTRHILGTFQAQPGARGWRRYLSENAHRPSAGVSVVEQALARVPIVNSMTSDANATRPPIESTAHAVPA